MYALLWPSLLALTATGLLVPVCRSIGLRTGHVASPRKDRWHRQPTPTFGGVAIAIVVLSLGAVQAESRAQVVLLVGGAAIFLVGLVDDIIRLKPYSKLIAEIAIASLFVFFGWRLNWSESQTIDALLTLVWIVGLTNAFNLLDNMDGLCGGVSLIAGATVLTPLVLRTGVTPEAQYLAILLGATAGFLVYNLHPAKIFMGDSGSLFIGLNLAVLTLTDTVRRSGHVERAVDRRGAAAHSACSDFRYHAGHDIQAHVGPERGAGRARSFITPSGCHRAV